MKTPVRYAMATLATAGITAAAALFGTGAAAAHPGPHPLLTSTCSFAQIDRALHAEYPKAAARLDAHPRAEARLAHLFSMSPAQREAAIHKFLSTHPGMAARHHQMMLQWMNAHPDLAAHHRAAAMRLAATCHSF